MTDGGIPLTQTEAAKRARLTPQKWWDIENGKRKIATIEMLERIARALGVSAKELLN